MKSYLNALTIFLLAFMIFGCNNNADEKYTYNNYFKRAIVQIEENYSGFNNKYLADSAYYFYLKEHLLNKPIYSQQELIKSLESYLAFFKDDHLYLRKIRNTKKSDFSFIVDNSNSVNRKKTNKNIHDFRFGIIDSNTSYLKVPTFDPKLAHITDSIIKNNYSQITSSNLLIIDIRGNGGGGDGGWIPLMPFIYTNAIKGINIELFTSKDNVIYTKQYGKRQSLHDEMDSFPNSYVSLFGDKYLYEMDLNYVLVPKPKFVAVLVDREVMSAGERFVLVAKQSMKTKIFGENTKGGIDYTNLRFVDIIPNELKMSIPTTRSAGLPVNSIDASGIVPDFYLDMAGNPINDIIKIYKDML